MNIKWIAITYIAIAIYTSCFWWQWRESKEYEHPHIAHYVAFGVYWPVTYILIVGNTVSGNSIDNTYRISNEIY